MEVCITSPTGCGIDPTASAGEQTVECNSSNEECALYQFTGGIDDLKGLFGHRTTTGWTKSGFTRKVYLQEIVADTEVSATVQVTWKAGALGDRQITLTEHLFNWYDSN